MTGNPGEPSILSFPGLEEPIRAELYSTERLEESARALGKEHGLAHGFRKGRPLLPRLRENGRVLLESYRAVADAIREERTISPAAEWLVDNFHIVEEQLREIRDDMPPHYYHELPKLDTGPLEGYPRVYALTTAFVAHTDSRFDPETLRRFVIAYQTERPLTMGELWAVAITLRLVLVENLRRLAERIVRRRIAREEAEALADSLLGIREKTDEPWEETVRTLDRKPLTAPFAVHLLQRLRESDPEQTPALAWLTKRIEEQGLTPDEIVRLEHQEQVATHVTVRNVITSMRHISSVDWADFFESVSLVEQTLRRGTRVAEMDFPTRDRYRHAIEDLSRRSRLNEIEIAESVVRRARAAGSPGHEREADPGYFLISRGRAEFEREVGYRVPLSQWLRRAYFAAATHGYIGTILVATVALLAVPLALSAVAGDAPWKLVVLALLALVPASEVAITLVNRDVTELVGPRRLPKLELAGGLPPDLQTLVVVPALLESEDEVRELAERIEVHHLATAEENVRFALLSDFLDAAEETTTADEPLFVAARGAIEELNRRHGPTPDGARRFLFLQRRRVWNPREAVWMGWERKRGKLHELNLLLRGAGATTYLPIDERDRVALQSVRYVLTLDADTRLPRSAVRELVGALAHPLNRPVSLGKGGRVADGYALLQPRVTPTLPLSGFGTLYQRMSSGPAGIDPYAAAVSDVYQDLFGEGIYTGKGIYDVDAFEKALEGRIPDDTLLSHDLFEGLFARAGLVSDVELFENFPAHYGFAASRQHRWVRGDWQLLPWLLPRVPDASRRSTPNPIPAIGRWKIVDNLRRSLSAPAAFLTLAAGWILSVTPAVWTVAILTSFALPGLFSILAGLRPPQRGISKRSFLRGLGQDFATTIGRSAFSVAVLAHQAVLMGDAILRTLFRMLLTRRRLLEWVTAARTQSGLDLALSGFYRRMGSSVALGFAAGAAGIVSGCDPALVAPFVAVWAAAPWIAWSASLPPRDTEEEALSEKDRRLLLSTARRTFRFFEAFVSAEDNNLPPDNFQDAPRPVVARRTSPTNIGLSLLSTVAARDFGWIGTIEMVERLEATFAALERLERYRGHLYNWYSTARLEPLEPRYISTVDSGNFVGHLIALQHACRERILAPVLELRALHGIADAVALARESLVSAPAAAPGNVVTRRELEAALRDVEALLSPLPPTVPEWGVRLAALRERAEVLADLTDALAHEIPDPTHAELHVWAKAALASIVSHERDFGATLGWMRGTDGGHAGDPFPGIHSRSLRDGAPGALEHGRFGEPRSPRVAPPRHRVRGVARPPSLHAVAARAAGLVEATDFGFLFDPDAQALLDRLPGRRRAASTRATTTCSPPRRGWRASSRSPRATSRPTHWFRLGRPLTPVGRGSALVSWSGSMFEYLMPALVMRAPAGSLLEQTDRLVVAPADRVRRRARRAVGRLRVGLQRPRPRADLPVLELRRAGPRARSAASARTSSSRPTRRRWRRWSIRRPRRATSSGSREVGAQRAVRLLRGARLHGHAGCPRDDGRASSARYMAHHQGMTIVALANVLHGGAMRDALPRRADRPGDRAAAPGADAARRRRRAARGPRRWTRPHVARLVAAGPAALHLAARPDAAHAPALERPLRGDGHRGGLGLQPLAATRGHALARGRDPRRLGDLRLPARRAERRGLVGGLPAERRRGRTATRSPSREDRAEFHRRDGAIATTLEVVVSPEDDAEIRRVSITNLGLAAARRSS